MLCRFGLLASQSISLAAFAQAPEVPPLPVEHFGPEVREQILRSSREAESAPSDPQAWGRLGMLLHAHRQYASAADCYRRARHLEPHSFRWTYYLALAEAEQGRIHEAIPLLEWSLELNPDDFPAALRRAEWLLEAHRVEEARDSFRRLAFRHPDSALVQYGLGRAETSLGHLSQALHHLQRACELAPDFGGAHYALALLYRRLGKPEEAGPHLEAYTRYGENRPPGEDPLREEISRLQTGPRYWLEKGLQLQARGNLSEAIQAYQQALQMDPGYAHAHVNLLSVYVAQGNWRKAESHYRAALEIHPNLPEAHYNFGILLSRTGQWPAAAKAFRKALEINPYYAEAHNNLGALLAREGNLEEAERHFRWALENKPDYREASFNLARLLMRRKRPLEAIPVLEQAVGIRDEHTPQLLYTLADAYARTGALRKALATARQALELAESLGQADLAARLRRELAEAGGEGP